jgi:outer membrane scaffolding protein for murein synthesis (MipA/OmpV family)
MNNRVFLILLAFTCQSVMANEPSTKKGKWTFGVGLLGANLPHYTGAEQSKSLLLPFPFINYKSEKLTIGRDGIVQKLWQLDNLSLTISGHGSIRIDSKDNVARQGMEDLGWVGAIGPALNWYWSQDKSLYMQFAARKAFALDDGIKSIGWQGEASLNWASQKYPVSKYGDMLLTLSGKMKFGDDRYHGYYYDIASQYVTAKRQAYDAASGFAGTELVAGLSFASSRYRAGIFARYSNINNATFQDSPLVLRQHNTTIGFMVAWLFSKS